MSSPLSLLRKTKRTPLQDPLGEHRDRKKAPFKRTPFTELRDRPADDVGSSVPHPPPTSDAPDGHAAPAKAKAHSRKDAAQNLELMPAMMDRLCLLEQTVRRQAQEIKSKDKRIQALGEKLRLKKQPERVHDLSGGVDLDKRCKRLQNRVCEMESFLNDYGLIWVGEGESSGSAEPKLTPDVERGPTQPDASAVGNFHMNFDLVLQRIRDLNFLAGEGECFVQSTITGAQLAKKNPIGLSLYRNGIVMFDGPFRSYQEQSARQCMQDLMDGYFPAELQERFPDRVPFEVYDRRDKEFHQEFPGEGRILGGKKHKTDLKKLRVDQFLSKSPKAGPAMDIRDSLRHVLQGSSPGQSSESVVPIETAAMQMTRQRLQTHCPDRERPPSAQDVINLKVKSEDGSQTFTAKMYLSETIGHLRQYVDQHRGGSLSAYDIISTHPQRCYHDDSQMLRSCGLITNVTLLLRKKKQLRLAQ
ncbi:UBX domain-containing protein 11 [Brachionichthys hirsutus]|uniref:UBX domain-containing protein 11 n=1 Tax=Brachionichthys hirsutus TaxID=412623 RepID=UPI003604D3FD